MIDFLTFVCVALLVLESPVSQKRVEAAVKQLKGIVKSVQRAYRGAW